MTTQIEPNEKVVSPPYPTKFILIGLTPGLLCVLVFLIGLWTS